MFRTITALAGVAMIAGIAACNLTSPSPSAGAPPAPPVGLFQAPGGGHAAHGNGSAGELSAEANAQIAQLRRLLAPFHNFEKAVAYGYEIPVPAEGVCLSDPVRGGMGYHYAYSKKDLVGDGEVNLMEPEFLVYSPDGNGHTRLGAVDYFVPYDTWPHADPPSLLGVPFVREDAFGAFVLHIWAFWPNPDGIFMNFNRAVPQCPA